MLLISQQKKKEKKKEYAGQGYQFNDIVSQ